MESGNRVLQDELGSERRKSHENLLQFQSLRLLIDEFMYHMEGGKTL